MTITILHGDCRQVLQTMAERSVQCVVTSPPYYGLRRYSDDPREIGQEAQSDCLAWARKDPPCGSCYVCAMREVFAGLWRVLRDDGTVWLNLGDSYSAGGRGGGGKQNTNKGSIGLGPFKVDGISEKQLLGIPWRVALALQSDGWYLRSDIIWSKPNPMPESVTDRPTRAHEYVFLLAKSARYFYDAAAIAEAATATENRGGANKVQDLVEQPGALNDGFGQRWQPTGTRNRRTVWSIATQPTTLADECEACYGTGVDWAAFQRSFGVRHTDAEHKAWCKANPCPVCHGTGRDGSDHYATMPEALIEPCILAGSSAQACPHCGAPWVRVVDRGMPSPDSDRPQQRRAADLWIEKGLTDEHLIALRAVGMADASKAQVTMTGYGKNTPKAQRLADEAKAALGGYYREFLTGTSSTTGFTPSCTCPDNTGSAASIVLDPFCGSGTVLRVAARYQRNAIGIELNQEYIEQHVERRTNGVQVEMTGLYS